MNFSALTYFDAKYINRGIALVCSALSTNKALEMFYIQTLDLVSFNEVSKYFHLAPRIRILPPTIIQNDLVKLKEKLESNQLFFALKPVCIQSCIEQMDVNGVLVYMDADLFFYRELPNSVLTEKSPVILSEHIFSNRTRNHSIYGRYNAGLIVFRLNESSCHQFIKVWSDSCISTALTTKPNFTFSDQVILEEISKQFRNIGVISDIRINQGLWSIDQVFIRSEKHKVDFMIRELIVYHFHGLQENDIMISMGDRRYGRTNISHLKLIRKVYVPYFKTIEKIRIKRGIANHLLPIWKVYLYLLTRGKLKW